MWPNLYLESRKTIIRRLARIQAEILGTSFSQIGSLYEEGKGSTSSRFYVGPSAPPVQIERTRVNRGPWSTARAQMQALMSEQLDDIQSDSSQVLAARKHAEEGDDSSFDIGEFRMLYAAIQHLIDNVRLLDRWEPSFCLSHPDLTKSNILVGYEDPTCIMGIIDWEGARIQPWVRH